MFEVTCESNGLARFPGHHGYRFVTPILLHGGIPNDSLSSFYRLCILPAMREHNSDVRELIDHWLYHSTARYHLAKPAKHFLEQRSAIVEDFVLRCIEASIEIEASVDDATLASLGLPSRVVSAFKESVSRSGHNRSAVPSKIRLPAPHLFFDPIRGGVWCHNPSIALPEGSSSRVEWRLKIGATEIRQPVACFRVGKRYYTEEDQIYIPTPRQVVEVSLVGVTPTPRVWTFKAALADQLFLFNSHTGRLLPARGFVPAADIWVIAPSSSRVSASGGRRLQQGPPLNDGWREFEAFRWDFSDAEELKVDEATLAVSAEGSVEPFLDGGRFFDRRQRHASFDYAEWPELCIPAASVESEGPGWKILIVSEGLKPTSGDEVSISSSASHDGRFLRVDLSTIAPTIPGEYRITAKGGLGRRAQWTIRYTAGARILEHPPLRIPEAGCWPEASIQLSIPRSLTARVSSTGISMRSAPEENQVSLHFDGDTSSGVLRIEGQEEDAFVEVAVGVPSLGWRLSPGGGDWARKPLVFSRESIEAAGSHFLQVRTLPAFLNIDLDVEARVSDGHIEETLQVCHRAGFEASYDLREIAGLSDTRYAKTALELIIPRRQTPVPVFVLAEHLRLSHFSAAVLNEHFGRSLIFEWTESGPRLRDRLIRLWSKSRPWEDPHRLRIDDEAEGETTFRMSKDELRPGAYLAELVIDDPWRGVKDRYPDAQSASVCELTIGTPTEVEDLLTNLPETVSSFVERAIAFESVSYERCKEALQCLEKSSTQDAIPLMAQAMMGASRGRDLSSMLADNSRVALIEFKRQMSSAPHEVLAFADRMLLEAGQEAWPQLEELLLACDALTWDVCSDDQQHLFSQVWSAWPALGLSTSARAVVAQDPLAVDLVSRGCGLADITKPVDGSDELSGGFVLREALWTQADLIGAFEPQIPVLDMPPEILRSQMDAVGVLQKRMFDKEGWALANYEWVITCQRPQVEALVEELTRARKWLYSRLQSLAHVVDDEVVRSLSELMLKRYDRSNRHRVVNVRFVVGAVSLLHRVWASRPSKQHLFANVEREWRGLVPLIRTIAPSLFDRDLSYISLALAQGDQSPVIQETLDYVGSASDYR